MHPETGETPAATAAIDELRAMLQPDGYDLVVTATSGELVDLAIVAGDDACEECLVPQSIFEQIVSQRLANEGLRLRELAYPSEAQ